MSVPEQEKKTRSLEGAIKQIRSSVADRDDAVSDLADLALTRLRVLEDELRPVTAQIQDRDRFPMALQPADPPRFWIDITTHVAMNRDHRIYRILKDTGLGRIVLLESDKVDKVADEITEMVARRIIEFEKTKESDLLLTKLGARTELQKRERRRVALRSAFAGLLIGLLAGAGGLFAYAWFFYQG
ncbi:hypothetical protein [Coralliovum pocilloporae]|uniref:hypothetical protein n=1 Tax=Coralliovum pocilloporae TaxID=3066369 RepID=UPI0033079D0A